jgi:putative FmdB family regulatory protein
MPFYEYECSSCHHTEEMLQKISAAPLRKCPACGKNTFKRLISAPVFRLKGSGWYETDFKSDKENKRNLAGTQPEAAEKAEATGEAKSEVKSEAKQEAAPTASAKPESAKPEATARPRAAAKSPGRSRRPTAQRATAPRSTAKRPAAKKRGSRRGTR